jgi:hypothetical protein
VISAWTTSEYNASIPTDPILLLPNFIVLIVVLFLRANASAMAPSSFKILSETKLFSVLVDNPAKRFANCQC